VESGLEPVFLFFLLCQAVGRGVVYFTVYVRTLTDAGGSTKDRISWPIPLTSVGFTFSGLAKVLWAWMSPAFKVLHDFSEAFSRPWKSMVTAVSFEAWLLTRLSVRVSPFREHDAAMLGRGGCLGFFLVKSMCENLTSHWSASAL